MEKQMSAYLRAAKPFLQRLVRELNTIYPYASVLGQDSTGRSFGVSRTGMNASESEMFTAHGFVVRVWDGGYAEYSFNVLPDVSPAEFARQISEILQVPGTADAAPQEDEQCVRSECSCKIWPDAMSSGEILEKLASIREYALGLDEKLLDASVSCSYQVNYKLFLSPARDMEQSQVWASANVFVMALRGEEMKDSYRSVSCLGGLEVLEQLRECVPGCVKTVVDLLDSQPITPGEYECVCSPEVTGMIVHEAFGHGVEMDMFVKKRALAEEYVGEYVASPLVNMIDGASAAEQTATFAFDDEGTAAQSTVVIENGVLRGGICDGVSAGRLGVAPTGNGRRESFARKAYTRMTNTFFTGGTDKPEDMIASIRYGFLLEDPSSGMEDPKNWGIQCMVSVAREIRDGKLTGKVFSPIVLTGYVPDLLKSISMMSENVELSGSGFCGKGYKEWVKVSDGGPWIKAKIRLG